MYSALKFNQICTAFFGSFHQTKDLRGALKALLFWVVSMLRYEPIRHIFHAQDAYKTGQNHLRPNTTVWYACVFCSEKWRHRPKLGLFSGGSWLFPTTHRTHSGCRWCCSTKNTAGWHSTQALLINFDAYPTTKLKFHPDWLALGIQIQTGSEFYKTRHCWFGLARCNCRPIGFHYFVVLFLAPIIERLTTKSMLVCKWFARHPWSPPLFNQSKHLFFLAHIFLMQN